MVVHYHGTPVWGAAGKIHKLAVRDAGAFVSYIRPDQLKPSLMHARGVGIDNGAFSAWRKGITIDWLAFYQWLEQWLSHPKVNFFVIPDVVEGGEADNDQLISQCPAAFREKAAPVWHLHESIDRLIRLGAEWPRICLGSSGEYAVIRTAHWHRRMHEAFAALDASRSTALVHGLRMLDGRVLGNYPLNSADSTNLASNIPKFEVKYPELTRTVRDADYARGLDAKALKELIMMHRCAVLKGAIEAVLPPPRAIMGVSQRGAL